MADESTVRGVLVAIAGATGAVCGAFFRWLVERARQKSEDDRWARAGKRFEKLESANEAIVKLHTDCLVKNAALITAIKFVRKQNAEQQVQIDRLTKQLEMVKNYASKNVGDLRDTTQTVADKVAAIEQKL